MTPAPCLLCSWRILLTSAFFTSKPNARIATWRRAHPSRFNPAGVSLQTPCPPAGSNVRPTHLELVVVDQAVLVAVKEVERLTDLVRLVLGQLRPSLGAP